MRREELLLIDLVERADAVATAIRGANVEMLVRDERVQATVMWPLVLIGEAARRLPDGFRVSHPDVPWDRINGFRNVALHAYETLDLYEVWRIAVEDVPALREQVLVILRAEFPLAARSLEERGRF